MGNKLFGTDGVRGVANVYPMTAEFALKLGMAAGQLICRKTRRAAVARDTRISGEMLEAALTAGFNAAGVTVLKLGVIPTPAATMLTPSLGVDMTVMITASHNPYQDNGIKLINADGDKFSDAETARIEAAIAADDFKLNPDEIGVSEAVPD
ncbi:MAG: phosphoglucosamine mutase, partial [Alphaproteobacteria bacterium]